jgi:hypothetical protein
MSDKKEVELDNQTLKEPFERRYAFGGKRGGPGITRNKGNRHAAKDKNNMLAHTMTVEELDEWKNMDTNILSQLEFDIKLITIRIRRMMERIAALDEEAFTITQKINTKMKAGQRVTDTDVTTRDSNLILIQQIEEALTRLQEKKSKLIETKHKYESTQHTNESADIAAFVRALGGSMEDVWAEESANTDGGALNEEPAQER